MAGDVTWKEKEMFRISSSILKRNVLAAGVAWKKQFNPLVKLSKFKKGNSVCAIALYRNTIYKTKMYGLLLLVHQSLLFVNYM